jgi:hypothetical protein
MGHARCEELMGFNMGLASMCMEEKWRDEDGGCSSYVLWRSVGVLSEMEVAEFVKQTNRRFGELLTVFEVIQLHNQSVYSLMR